MTQYIRRRQPNDPPPPRGWSVVILPPDGDDPGGTYEVEEPLAAEMHRLIRSGQPRAARTLFFWFDTEER
jgi:hypothetical protein